MLGHPRKLVTTFPSMFLICPNVGYEIRQPEKSPRKAMKGFAANLTASRLEEMLAFYMTPEEGSHDEADDIKREHSAAPVKPADHTTERGAPLAALTEN